MLLVLAIIALTTLVAIPAALVVSTVVLAAAVLFVRAATVAIATVRPDATGETDEASHQQ